MKATLQGFTVRRHDRFGVLPQLYEIVFSDGSFLIGNDVPHHLKTLMYNGQATSGKALFTRRDHARIVAKGL